MQKSYLKNIFRTIGSSFGRYLALISIVMLGVIFYTGLKVTTDDMVDTANDFYAEGNFYDYSLVSTVGFDTEDIFELRKKDKVLNAEGAYYQDMIVTEGDDSSYVVRIHSLTEKINVPALVAGRLPIKANECVVDGRYYDSSYIGKTITVTDDNTQDSLDDIVYRELVITGVIDSPLYLSYQRGTTGIGNGSIHAYIFVNYEFFGIDYYTQLFIDTSNEGYIYSDAYNDLAAADQEIMEGYAEQFGQARFDRLSEELADGQEKYSNALKEYNEGKKEFDDAEASYKDAFSKNEDAKEQLEMLRNQLEALRKQRQEYLDEYSYKKANALLPQITYMENTELTVAEAVKEADGQLAEVKAELDENRSRLEDSLKELEENAYIMDEKIGSLTTYALTRDDNIGYSSFKENADIVASIAYIFPLFFVLVAGLVCMTTMSRMIEEERTQIGVFKSLGYSKGKVFAKYIVYSLSATVIGVILGFYIGSNLFPTVIWKAYMIMYTFTDRLNIIYDYRLFAVSMAAALVVLVGSTVFTCYRVMNEAPAEMIRPKAPAPGKRVFLEKIGFVWKRLPFLHKVSIRNCFRYKKRFFMMLIGIAGCTALLIIGYGIQDSISSICNDQYDRIETYDYLISTDGDLSDEQLSALKDAIGGLTSDCSNVAMSSADASKDSVSKEVSVIACKSFDDLDGFLSLTDINGKLTANSPDECVISQNLADSLGLSAGEEITVSFDNLKKHSYKISGIYENYIRNYIVLTDEAYAAGSGEKAYMNCFFANVNEGTDIYQTLAELSGLENVSSVSATQVTRDYFNEMIKSLDAIVVLVIVCAAVLAFVVLYNLNNINIMERVREIATIKVLGFYKSETAQYVFRENVILTLLGTLCGLPLGCLMHRIVMSKIKIDMICFDIHVEPSSYLISAGLTILFSVFVELFMRGKIYGVNMSESLKSVE